MSANVKVSIPVEIGGYTGQRDAWESLARDYEVALLPGDDQVVVLNSQTDVRRRVSFSLTDLEGAIAFLRGRGE